MITSDADNRFSIDEERGGGRGGDLGPCEEGRGSGPSVLRRDGVDLCCCELVIKLLLLLLLLLW